MVFNSLQYILFLVAVVTFIQLLQRRQQNLLLLVASYLFYAAWDYRFLSLLVISTIVDFCVAKKLASKNGTRSRRMLLGISLATNLGILGLFKYFNFFQESFAVLLREFGLEADWPTLNIILPVGISFYTFQTLAYSIDVFRRKIPACNSFLDFALYVSFFPQLVAGPIERAQNLLPQIQKPRSFSLDTQIDGVWLILIGLVRKVVIADSAGNLANEFFANPGIYPASGLLIGCLLFGVQIYGDFAGYSDIARGSAKLLGFELMKNFEHPYFSRSITEFWRRWHISLSQWLRDYLYIPLGGNRISNSRTYINLFLTMVIGGLWHGAAWTFVVWGLLHGAFLAIHKAWKGSQAKEEPSSYVLRRDVLRTISVVGLVSFAWIFFRADNFEIARVYIERILTVRGDLIDIANPGKVLEPAFVLTLVLCLMLCIDLPQYRSNSHVPWRRWPAPMQGMVAATALVLVTLFSGGNDLEFIYFQF